MVIKDKRKREVLCPLANDEKRHYEVWKNIIGKDTKPVRWKVGLYYLMARLLGLWRRYL